VTAATEITIIGAGPVGALMSIFLARRGLAVTIHERRPDMRRVAIPAGRSINLALANRSIHALEQVGLMEAVNPHLIPMRGRMIHHGDGKQELQPYGNKPVEVIYSVSRGELNKLLMDAAEAAGVVIRFNARCESLDLAQRELVLVDEAGGRTVPFEVLIGADGGGSVVRAAIAAATAGEVTEDRLGHGYKELTIPPAPGGGFRMEKGALHIWPRGGFMLIALPNTDGSFTATLFLPDGGDDGFASLATGEQVAAFFQRHFADAAGLIEDLAGSFLVNPTGALGTIRCHTWHAGGAALVIGDAAHAVVPFHGQGMAAGFEDCVALDGCIDRNGENWQGVFAGFASERKPNADAIAEMALENYLEMRDTVLDPKFLLRKELAWKLEELYPEKFIPRYSMVMFHLLPYAEAQRRGRLQAAILDELTATATSMDQIDLAHARRLIDEMKVELPATARRVT
jgi:kynurenine 3-monooxygenase